MSEPLSVNRYTLGTEEDTARLAQALKTLLHPVDCLTLTGTLGAGKTTFMQHLIHALGYEGEVTSPTFVIVQEYPVTLSQAPTKLYHMDAYRLEDPSECEEIGLGEMLENGICCIEWPEICADWLPQTQINITIDLENNIRTATIQSKTRQGEINKVLASLL